MRALYRQRFDAQRLTREFPLDLPHPHKRLVNDLCGPPGGELEVARFAEEPLPASLPGHVVDAKPVAGYFAYGSDAGVWHVNFADPDLFFAYGSALLAQDELQCAEHPSLGSIREAMGEHAFTEDEGRPTPVTVAGVERRCEIRGLYGNAFAAASPETVRAAVHVIAPPTISNILAIAAPNGGRGEYTRETIETALVTAYTGYRAAAFETARLRPSAPVEIRTGFWGCGAFGGNRTLMTLVQLLAARLAQVPRLRFYVADDAGHAPYQAGVAALADVTSDSRVPAIIDRITARGFRWGVGNGT